MYSTMKENVTSLNLYYLSLEYMFVHTDRRNTLLTFFSLEIPSRVNGTWTVQNNVWSGSLHCLQTDFL